MNVQVPLDENTDPTSLRRSNCSVDGDILGKCASFFFCPYYCLIGVGMVRKCYHAIHFFVFFRLR